jgi:hypothetical protein
MGATNNENPQLGSKHETIGDQREPTHWEFFGEGPGTVFLQKKGVPGAFTYKRAATGAWSFLDIHEENTRHGA